MNRTILIVICDFLLVSLLAFSTVDINKASGEGVEREMKLEMEARPVESGKDLAAAMRLALDDEQKNRDLLKGELEAARDTARQQDALLSEKDALLSEREGRVREQDALLRERDARLKEQDTLLREREALLRERETLLTRRDGEVRAAQAQLEASETQAARMRQEQAGLEKQFVAAQTNLQALGRQLQESSRDTALSRERIAAMEAEMRRRTEAAAALQQQIAHLARSNEVVLTEKQRLAGQLQVAEVEKRHAAEQVVRMQEQVNIEREEKARLAEGVKILATRSSQLAEEIRENRPLTPNTIFSEFVTNRVQSRIQASRSGLFGNESVRRKELETVMATDGTNTFAVCHVDDTPLSLWTPGTEWEGLSGALNRNMTEVPIRSLSFHFQDPRVVMIPVTDAEARDLGARVYRISSDPYKFQDAVLIGAREGYYGECRFEMDLTTPEYVRLDRSVLKGLFGKFNPSRGDLVFSKTGELLGIMANSTYCLIIRGYEPAATFRFTGDVRDQRTGETLSVLHSRVIEMPLKLQ